jgi:hypothetical protein
MIIVIIMIEMMNLMEVIISKKYLFIFSFISCLFYIRNYFSFLIKYLYISYKFEIFFSFYFY